MPRPGYYAYTYYGYGDMAGWEPGQEYYYLPYAEEDLAELEPFEYGDMDSDVE